MSNLAQERQLERIKYIDLCSYILGYMNRKLLMNRFEVKQAWATKDFAAYQEMSNNQLVYDHGLRAYKPSNTFEPLFKHSTSQAIELLTNGTQEIVCEPQLAKQSYSYQITNVEPKLENIYCVLRGLYLNRKVEIEYISRSSGKTTRKLVPHSLISTGSFHYARAFDDRTNEFRSFKLNRIVSSSVTDETPLPNETREHDEEWNQDVKLTIVCNGEIENKEAIEFDFGLKNGELKVVIKKALLMYFLMDWNIAPMEHTNLPTTLFPLRLISVKNVGLN